MPTFLFTDIEGSTRLWETQPEAMTAALGRHDSILTGAVTNAGGRVLKTTGDGVVAIFEDVSGALAASLSAQRELGLEPWQVGPIRVRMGVHTGESETRDGDFFGPVLNRTARIMAAAHGGQVLVSGAAADTGRVPDGVTLRDLGTHRLKDLTLPERLYQLVHDDIDTEFPAPTTLDARPNNLPIQATEFLGRSNELTAIRVMLESPTTRLLTITGPGGAGKTRLALQVAAEHLDQFRDGVFFVDVSAERDPEAAYEAIVRALALPSSDSSSPMNVLVSRLGDKEMLLILDNFEQVTAAAVGVAGLLQRAPRLKVLVTSRETLRVRAEHVFPVPPLGLPHPNSGVAAIADSEAVQLFVERARTVRPDFELTEDNAATIAAICLRLDGLPLAIELAAARLNVFTPSDLLQRITERLDILGAGGRDLPDRQRTLWGAIGWSYELLDRDECDLFEIMSVFSSSDLQALEVVAAAIGHTGSVLDSLSSLVDKSLVRAEGQTGTQRFSMLLMIREYAVTRLAEDPEREQRVREAHAAYYSERARGLQTGLRGPGRDAVITEIGTEIGNLRAAWRFWVQRDDVTQLFNLIDGLWALHEAKGWYQAAIELANDTLSVLANTPASPDIAAEELAIRTSLARALMAVRGYGPEVEKAFQQVLSLAESSGGTAAQRFPVLRALATYHMNLTHFDRCAEIGQTIIDLGESEGDDAMVIEGHYVLGTGTAFGGDIDTGLTHLDKVTQLFDPKVHVSRTFQLGPNVAVVSRVASGLLRYQTGALDRGVREVQRALEIAREIDHPYSVAYALYHNGFLALIRQRFEECGEIARELGPLAAEHGYPVWQTLAFVLEGASMTALGNAGEGVALTERGVELYQGLTTPPIFWPEILNLRAMVHAMGGDPDRALQLVDEAIAVGGSWDVPSPEFHISKGDILTMLPTTEVSDAEAAYESAADGARQLGLTTFELIARTRLVRLRRARGGAHDRIDELTELYSRFTEGHEEVYLVEAREMIG